MGLLGLRAGKLDAFSDEQLRDSILATNQAHPRIEDYWIPLTNTVLGVLDKHAEWYKDIENLVKHPSLSAESCVRMATEAIGHGHQRSEIFYERGLALNDLQDYSGAESDFTEAIARSEAITCGDFTSRDFGIFSFRGLVRLQMAIDEDNEEARFKIVQDAESDFGKALEAGLNGIEWYFRGTARAELGEYAGAEKDFGQAIMVGKEPGLGAAQFRRGQVREEQGNYQEAEADFTRAIELGRNDIDVYNSRAKVRMRLHKFSGAMEDFSEAIDRGRTDIGVYIQRGLALFLDDQLEEAERDFSYAITRDPDLAEVYYHRGMTRHSRENLIEAEQDYSRAIELGYKTADVFSRRGSLRQSLKRFSEAESDLTQAIEHGMDDSRVYVNRAFGRLQGAMPGAADDFTRAIDRGEQGAGMYFFRGIVEDDDEAAEADFTMAIKKGMSDVYVYTNRALMRIRLGNLDGAREDCVRARELDPDSATTYRGWGYLHLSLCAFDNAIASFQAAINVEEDPRYHFDLGLAQLLSGKLNEVEATYRSALEKASADDARYAAHAIEWWSERQKDRIKSSVTKDIKARILSELTASFDNSVTANGTLEKEDPKTEHKS
jgi:tetratricopeptide (TPR) repeat protein